MMTESDLLLELAAELSPTLDPEEVTAQMLADKTGVSWSKASAMLNLKVAAGELTVRNVRLTNGHNSRAFRKA